MRIVLLSIRAQVRAVYEERAAREHHQPYRVALSDYLKGKDLLTR
jgi:hypothetical protein